MEEIGIVASSLPSEASNNSSSTATSTMIVSSSTTAATAMEPSFSSPSLPPNQLDIYSNNNSPGQVETGVATSERTSIPLPELKAMLRQQLEYYFSRENLATDAYLRSQMDGDQYVPISTIAKFNQIRRLTEDLSLVVEVLRESPYVQVDEAGEKVRPSQRSIVLILREIPESTPMKDLEELFSGENCPKFSRCEFAHNDTWYVLFDTDDDAKRAYCYLREEAKTFNGKPIMARIKASLTSAPYSHSYYKNGICPPTTETYTTQQLQAPPQPAQPQPAQQQTHVQYTYANVPSDTYNNQQMCPPFYPPTMLQAWAPTTPACVDLGAVFSMNGLSPQAAFRPVNNTSKSTYPSRDRSVKSFNPPQSYSLNRNDQSSRYFGRNIPRQQPQQQQQPPFNLINAAANSCSFDYGPYATTNSLRNLHSFGLDMNTFAAPNFCFRRLQSHTSSYTQSRHAPLLLPAPRSQIGVGAALSGPDQTYLSVANSMIPFHKDAVTGASVSRQNVEMQNKDTWSANQKQRNKKWSRENGTSTTSKPFPEASNGTVYNKSVNGADPKPESPKFNLQTASFPPLPGCLENDILEVDVSDNTRLSDIVKGTAKPSTRDSKTQTSESSLVIKDTMKDSSTLTVEETGNGSENNTAFLTPVTSSSVISESMASTEVEKSIDWLDESCSDASKEESNLLNSNSINCTTQTIAFNLVTSPVSLSPTGVRPPTPLVTEDISVPSEVIVADKQPSPKMPKPKPPDNKSNKMATCDLPSPKSKTPDALKPKTEIPSKDKLPKPHRVFPVINNKLPESSLSSAANKTDSNVSSDSVKNSETFSLKEKPPVKGRSFELTKTKSHDLEPSVTLMSINGHVDSESVSSEDEKPYRKLTYSEVAIRAKEKVEKMAQELKEKERQEAMVRHHRQQEIVAQGGPFREFNRRVNERPGSRDWRERRKPSRTASLPSPGQ